MIMNARFPGKCKRCGGAIAVGDEIEWSPGGGATHITCPEQESVPEIPKSADGIKISNGEGYGGRDRTVGSTFRHQEYGIVTVLTSNKLYYSEDGMSFGVGDDQGYVYKQTVRLATLEESAPILETEAQRAALKSATTRVAEIKKQIQDQGEQPWADQEGHEGIAPRAFKLSECEVVMDDRTIYGGGDGFRIEGAEWIWHVQHHSADGDSWANNNLHGAMGWRIPYDQALAAELRNLAATITKTEVQ